MQRDRKSNRAFGRDGERATAPVEDPFGERSAAFVA